MVREQRNELLADHAGRAKDADGYRSHAENPKKKADADEPCRQVNARFG
jgi:hypothetical protein